MLGPMSIEAVILAEQARNGASEARRIEWDANIRQFLSVAGDCIEQEGVTLHIDVTEQQFLFELKDAQGSSLGAKSISHQLLAEHINEYVDIMRQIAEARGLNRLEALDMAKKVTHDRAARALKREIREFQLGHEALRRLFTLMLSLRVDTTRLMGVHGHRTIR
jgi:uncharacterized protein (UPF0262 family)